MSKSEQFADDAHEVKTLAEQILKGCVQRRHPFLGPLLAQSGRQAIWASVHNIHDGVSLLSTEPAGPLHRLILPTTRLQYDNPGGALATRAFLLDTDGYIETIRTNEENGLRALERKERSYEANGADYRHIIAELRHGVATYIDAQASEQ